MTRLRLGIASLVASFSLLASAPVAHADDVRWHALAGGAHALANPQAHEFGFGATGALALELPIGKVLGIQGELGGLWLGHTNPPANPRIADHGDGTYFSAMIGLRLRPFGASGFARLAGPWIDVNAGYAHTGSLSRGGIDTHIGWDFRIGAAPDGGRWDIGPFVGYTQILQPGDTLRPDDAHVLGIGVQVSLGAPFEVKARGDRDNDGVFDDEDACPDVAGVRTTDPKTNGCPPPPKPPPPPDRDGDGILDADDACPDVKGVKTDDPKTNGCPPPPPDRDKDGIPDAEDACPDQAGPRDPDPKKNGCPVQGIHFERDQIVLDDTIYFETNVARVRHYSFPLIRRLADFINAHPEIIGISIEGHTDETGTGGYNKLLSQARAEAVKNMLVSFGVDRKKMTTAGWGKDRPIDLGHDEEAHKRNRRVEFIVTRERSTPNAPGGP